jgi:cytochrome b
MALEEYAVWDRPQRIFHWINVLAITVLAGIGLVILNADALEIPDDPGMIALKTTHVYAGYVFAANLAWRIVWGFVGGPSARWSALIPGGAGFGRRAREFIGGLLSGRAPAYLGHNPLARIVLTLLVLSMAVQAVTGLVIAGTDVYMPPFGGQFREWAAGETHDPALVRPYSPETVDPDGYRAMRAFRSPWVRTHEYNFFALVTLAVLHIAAAVFGEIREGGALISAMFTGRKAFDRIPVDLARTTAERENSSWDVASKGLE